MTDTTHGSRPPVWLVGLLLGGAVLAFYARACWLGFVNFDDDDYVYRNAHVQAGLSLDGIRWALTSLEEVNWHPLTWVSLELDTTLFGPGPAGYHCTNVVLHTANTVLLFWLLQRLTGAVWRSAAVAAFFGLHPVHVEPVVWVTARKDVLSTLCWLLAIAAYVRYARRPSVPRYLPFAALIALGLMAKQMLVTAPWTLLLLDYWPLRRWRPADGETPYAKASARRLVLEKLPLLALVIPAALLTIKAQAPIIHSLGEYTLYDRVANALVSYVRYLGMAFRPADLAILYPLPRHIPVWQPVAAFGLLAAVTVVLLRAGHGRRYPIMGWLWFLGTLFPVIGLIQNGPQARADRYAYVPDIGLFVLVVWGVAELCGRDRRWLAGTLAAAALGACLVLSWLQVNYWRDNEVLWRHTLAATPDNAGAHTMLGKTLLDDRRYAEAIDQFETALQLQPDNVANLGNLAVAYIMLGRFDAAAARLERSLELRSGHAATHFNLGWARERQGRLQEALKHYAAALATDPHLVPAGIRRATVLARLGESTEARRQLDRLIADNPDSTALQIELGRLLRREGRFAEAVGAYDRAIAIEPENVDAWNEKGLALENLGQLPEAADCYRRTIARKPDELLYRLNLAYVEMQQGHADAMLEQVREAFALQPNWPAAILGEAWTLATHPRADRRNGALALRWATLVCKVTDDQMGQAIEAQAAAYAELGRFDQAVARQRRVKELAEVGAPPEIREQVAGRLRFYERHQPYRQPVPGSPKE